MTAAKEVFHRLAQSLVDGEKAPGQPTAKQLAVELVAVLEKYGLGEVELAGAAEITGSGLPDWLEKYLARYDQETFGSQDILTATDRRGLSPTQQATISRILAADSTVSRKGVRVKIPRAVFIQVCMTLGQRQVGIGKPRKQPAEPPPPDSRPEDLTPEACSWPTSHRFFLAQVLRNFGSIMVLNEKTGRSVSLADAGRINEIAQGYNQASLPEDLETLALEVAEKLLVYQNHQLQVVEANQDDPNLLFLLSIFPTNQPNKLDELFVDMVAGMRSTVATRVRFTTPSGDLASRYDLQAHTEEDKYTFSDDELCVLAQTMRNVNKRWAFATRGIKLTGDDITMMGKLVTNTSHGAEHAQKLWYDRQLLSAVRQKLSKLPDEPDELWYQNKKPGRQLLLLFLKMPDFNRSNFDWLLENIFPTPLHNRPGEGVVSV